MEDEGEKVGGEKEEGLQKQGRKDEQLSPFSTVGLINPTQWMSHCDQLEGQTLSRELNVLQNVFAGVPR